MAKPRRRLEVRPENLKRRPDGSWAYRMSFGTDPVTGKAEQHQCTISAATRDEAIEKAQAWLDHWQADPKLSDALGKFVAQLERERANPRTLRSYRNDAARVSRAVGSVRVRDLTSHDVGRLWEKLLEGGSSRGLPLSSRSVQHTRVFLSQAYDWFCGEGYALVNPIKQARKFRVTKEAMSMLDEDDLAELRDHLAAELAMADGADPSDHMHAMAVYLGLYFGLRVGEVCGLRRRDVDLRRMQLRVCGKVVEVPDLHREAGTKTGRTRNIGMTDGDAAALGRYLDWQADLWPECQRSTHLVAEPGQLPRPSEVSRWFGTFAKGKYGLSRAYKFHALRHTHATILLEERVEPQTVAERLGHSHVSTTVDNYAHVMPGRDQAAAQAFGEALGAV